MALVNDEYTYDAVEVDAIDRALDLVPAEHMEAPLGIRSMMREGYFDYDGIAYPTVMAIYSREEGEAYLYDGSFMGLLGADAPVPMLPQFPIHALVGAALVCDEEIDAAWCKAMGFDERERVDAIMIDKHQIERTLDFEDGKLHLDFSMLPDGADFAVAYASYLTFPDELRAGSPKVFQHMFTVFGRKMPGRNRSDDAEATENGRRDPNATLKGELRI